jgi:hypothetical protein
MAKPVQLPSIKVSRIVRHLTACRYENVKPEWVVYDTWDTLRAARNKGELTSLCYLLDLFRKRTLKVLDRIESAMVRKLGFWIGLIGRCLWKVVTGCHPSHRHLMC